VNLPRASRRGAAGFTLIELVISSSLMALILGSAYACFSACVSSQKLIEPRLEAVQNARVALAILSADLRCACPLSKECDFLGADRTLGGMEADSVDFATHNFTPGRPREGDFCQESFFVEKEARSGQLCLWRRRHPAIGLDPLAGGRREEIARGLRGLRLEYYDGLDWYDQWGTLDRRKVSSARSTRGNLSGLPEAVRITLWIDPKPKARSADEGEKTEAEPPLVFQTVARLNLAGATWPSGGESAAAPDSSAVPGTPAPQPR
jgi:prepilin-type N-terminal cleavage/methylation domain-containing protein